MCVGCVWDVCGMWGGVDCDNCGAEHGESEQALLIAIG